MYCILYPIDYILHTTFHMGVSMLLVYSARAEMPNAQTWGVTAVSPQLAANSHTPNRHVCQDCPNT